jgi:CubicO group peptidase (beta-lactamase class C family)
VSETTRFQAASISKPITALAAVRLAQQHRLLLDEDVNKLLKRWLVPKSPLTDGHPVTLRSLLSHTSGADDGFGFPGYEPNAVLPTVPQILDGKPPSIVGPVLFKRAPYEAHKYSGGGLTIVQLALEDRTSKPFEKTLSEAVLVPLGMTHSSFDQPPHSSGAPNDYAYAHDSEGKRMGPTWHVYPELAAAGLWTTASDLAQVLIEVQRAIRGPNGKILTQASAHELIAPTGVGPFGVGFRILSPSSDGGWYFWHGGSNWGFECRLFGHVRKGYGVVIMTNSQGSGSALLNELETRIFTAYGWDKRGIPN